MTAFIRLTKIRSDREQNRYTDTDDPTEAQVVTQPVVVNVDSIRCYYPRQNERVGTRLTFNDGGGFAVTEAFETVDAMIRPNGFRD